MLLAEENADCWLLDDSSSTVDEALLADLDRILNAACCGNCAEKQKNTFHQLDPPQDEPVLLSLRFAGLDDDESWVSQTPRQS